jgi:hypothetical protein
MRGVRSSAGWVRTRAHRVHGIADAPAPTRDALL